MTVSEYLLSLKKRNVKNIFKTIRDINIPFDDCIPTALAIDDETHHLFIGSQKGSIYSISLAHTNSIVEKNIAQDSSYTSVHQGSITKV